MHGFYLQDAKRLLQLEEVEIKLLTSLINQVIQLLDLGQESSSDPLDFLSQVGKKTPRPEDEVVFRLLPDAYLNDEEANSDFRRFTEDTLRDNKLKLAQEVLKGIPIDEAPVEIPNESVETWLKVINDVRLALGTRLELTEDSRDLFLDPEKSGLYEVYDWLTWLQGALIETI